MNPNDYALTHLINAFIQSGEPERAVEISREIGRWARDKIAVNETHTNDTVS